MLANGRDWSSNVDECLCFSPPSAPSLRRRTPTPSHCFLPTVAALRIGPTIQRLAMSSTPQPSGSSNHPTTNTEYTIPSSPSHPVAALAFNPQPGSPSKGRQLLVASWDSTVRLLQLPDKDATSSGDVKANNVTEMQSFKHEAPVLDVCWINDNLAASGGIDRRVRL